MLHWVSYIWKIICLRGLLHKMQLVANWNSSRLHSKGTQSKYFVHVCASVCFLHRWHKGSREGLIESRGDDEKSQFSRRRFRENGFFSLANLVFNERYMKTRASVEKPRMRQGAPNVRFRYQGRQDTKFEISHVSPARNAVVSCCP